MLYGKRNVTPYPRSANALFVPAQGLARYRKLDTATGIRRISGNEIVSGEAVAKPWRTRELRQILRREFLINNICLLTLVRAYPYCLATAKHASDAFLIWRDHDCPKLRFT